MGRERGGTGHRGQPIEDEDPTTTERLKQVLFDLTEGEADPTLFTPEAQSRLSPEKLQQMSAFYRSLGPVQTLHLVEQKSDEQRTRRYREVFPDTDWIQTSG